MTPMTAIIEDGFSAVLTPDAPRAAITNDRSDEDYLIEALAKGLQVLEALKGHAYEPVSISYVSKKTGLTYDFCRRAIKTLKVKGWAIEDERGFRLSVKAMQFSDDFLKWAAAITKHQFPDSATRN